MKKIWLPYPLYFLKPFAVGFIGIVLLHVSEDVFTSVCGFLCLGYAGWILFMRIVWSIKRSAQSKLGKSSDKKDKTYSAKFPDWELRLFPRSSLKLLLLSWVVWLQAAPPFFYHAADYHNVSFFFDLTMCQRDNLSKPERCPAKPNILFLSLFAAAYIGYSVWILFMRVIWSNADSIKTRVGSARSGHPKTHYVKAPTSRVNCTRTVNADHPLTGISSGLK